MIGEEGKGHYVPIKDFNTLIYDHTLHHGKKHFCHYFLQEILKPYIKDYFKINRKQKIIMLKNGEYVRFKNHKREIKLPFMIYGDFESILVPEGNGKQNPKESCTNKYQKHIACSHGYKLVCVDNKFRKPFNIYLDEDATHNFINSMIEESKYCSDMWKNILTKTL